MVIYDPFHPDMDKEDAIVCFQEHIEMLEIQNDDEKENQRKMLKRKHRKNRESFCVSFYLIKSKCYCDT